MGIRVVLPRKGFVQPATNTTGYVDDINFDMALADTNVMFSSDPVRIRVSSTVPGQQPPLPHGLVDPFGNPRVPNFVMAQFTSAGTFWLQEPVQYDATNIYWVASDSGVTGYFVVW